MRTVVVTSLAVLLAAGLAQEGPGAMGSMTPAARDPRVLALRAEQAAVGGDPAAVKAVENRIQAIYLEGQPQPPLDGGGIVFGTGTWELPQMDRPDVVIDTGTIWATGADYEADGSMYVAYSRGRDSTVRIVKSTDHGSTWQPLRYFWTSPRSLVRRLCLVVGSGDSAFVYVMITHPDNNGDATCARFNRDGTNYTAFWVSHDTATVNNLTFCRDYVQPYYLYACVGDDDHATAMDDHMMRSTNFGKNWAQTNLFRFVSDGSYQAGAGKYLYLAGYPGYSPLRGQLNLLVNTHYGEPDSWRERVINPDTFEVDDPVMAPSFAVPPTAATIWALYSHNYQNSGDWDIKYVYSTDAGLTWSGSYYLASSSTAYEQYGDIKPYADSGNTWMNASYISEVSHRTVFRHYCNQPTPTGWSDTLRINTNSAGTGREIRPLLVYSPGSPGTGAGCVFTGAGLQNLYWNSPWTVTAFAEKRELERAAVFAVWPNPVTVSASLRWRGTARSLTLFDAAGRVVRSFDRPAGSSLTWDRRDNRGRRVASGVYCARLVTDTETYSRQLIVR